MSGNPILVALARRAGAAHILFEEWPNYSKADGCGEFRDLACQIQPFKRNLLPAECSEFRIRMGIESFSLPSWIRHLPLTYFEPGWAEIVRR